IALAFDKELISALFSIGANIFGKLEGGGIALLITDEIAHLFHLRGIHKSALKTNHVAADREQHVTTANELLGAACIEDGSGVNFGSGFESNTCREVGLDGSGDDIYRRTLRGQNEMDTYSPRKLS